MVVVETLLLLLLFQHLYATIWLNLPHQLQVQNTDFQWSLHEEGFSCFVRWGQLIPIHSMVWQNCTWCQQTFELLTEDCIIFLFWTSVKDRICNARNVGILTCPPPATAAPYTSPDITTLTQTEQRINVTESVVTDKSETVSLTKVPRTESKPAGTTRTGEKTTETTRARSTKNDHEAKLGRRIAENEMRKSM